MGQKVNKALSQPISWVTACACHSSYEGVINRRTEVQVSLGKNESPYPKNNKAKRVHPLSWKRRTENLIFSLLVLPPLLSSLLFSILSQSSSNI
jgi:hypothetical protein